MEGELNVNEWKNGAWRPKDAYGVVGRRLEPEITQFTVINRWREGGYRQARIVIEGKNLPFVPLLGTDDYPYAIRFGNKEAIVREVRSSSYEREKLYFKVMMPESTGGGDQPFYILGKKFSGHFSWGVDTYLCVP
jgi:hypothetical protein